MSLSYYARETIGTERRAGCDRPVELVLYRSGPRRWIVAKQCNGLIGEHIAETRTLHQARTRHALAVTRAIVQQASKRFEDQYGLEFHLYEAATWAYAIARQSALTVEHRIELIFRARTERGESGGVLAWLHARITDEQLPELTRDALVAVEASL